MNYKINLENNKLKSPSICDIEKDNILECLKFGTGYLYEYNNIYEYDDNIDENSNQNKYLKNIIKNSISSRIKNMTYQDASDNIKKRKNRLCGEKFTNDKEGEEINLIKNQEDSENMLTMSEHELPSYNPQENIDPEPKVKKNVIIEFLKKYKFWIIVCIILIILIFAALSIFLFKKRKIWGELQSKPEIIEGIAESPSTLSLPETPSIIKETSKEMGKETFKNTVNPIKVSNL